VGLCKPYTSSSFRIEVGLILRALFHNELPTMNRRELPSRNSTSTRPHYACGNKATSAQHVSPDLCDREDDYGVRGSWGEL
jgi:hypothetical protein